MKAFKSFGEYAARLLYLGAKTIVDVLSEMTFSSDALPVLSSISAASRPHLTREAPRTLPELSPTPDAANLHRLTGIIYGIVQGRPFTPSQKDTRKLFGTVKKQIAHMVAENLLPDYAAAYCAVRPTKHARQWPRQVGFNPTPENLLKSAQNITDVLGAHGTSAVHVLGARANQSVWLKGDEYCNVSILFDYERDRRAGELACAQAALNIAIPGELRAAHQLLRYLELRQHDAGAALRPLIIENARMAQMPDDADRAVGFWSPLLKVAGIIDSHGAATLKAQELGVVLTETREETIAQARQILAQTTINAVKYPPVAALHAPGTPLYLASTTEDKHDQVRATVADKGYDAISLPAEIIINSLKFPAEDRGTYEGNVFKKLVEAVRAYATMPESTRQELAKAHGQHHVRGSLLVEDSGFQVNEPNIAQGKEFDDVRHLVDPARRFPGVETGPALWSSGIKVFFQRLGVEVKRIAAQEGRAPDYGVTNTSLMALAPVAADAEGLRPVIMTFAIRQGSFADHEPSDRAANKDNFRMSDYLLPAGFDGKNETQLGEIWTAKAGTKPGALQAMAIAAGIEEGKPVRPGMVADYKTVLFRDGGPHNGEAGVIRRTTHGAVTVTYPPVQQEFADVQKHIFAPYDAIGLDFGGARQPANDARAFIKAAIVFFPAIVALQVRDKYMLGKKLALFGDEGGIARRFMAMVHDLHKLGGIPQEPRKLLVMTENVREFAEAVSKARKEYRNRYPPYSYAQGASILLDEGKPSPFDYNAAIYTSAHIKADYLLNLNRQVTEGLCQQGIGVFSGGGLNGGMGAITGAAHSLQKKGYDVHHTAVTTPHVQFLEGDDSVRKQVHRYILTNNIHKREELLSGSPNCGIVTAGGPGSMSEMFRLLATMYGVVANKAAPHNAPADQIVVIVNSRIPTRRRSYYDEVIKQMPGEILADPRVHVVKDADAALNIVVAHRARLMMRKNRAAAAELRAR